MATIIGHHADGSNCYTPGCIRMTTSEDDNNAITATTLLNDYKTHGAARPVNTPAEPLPAYQDEDEQEWWEMIRTHHKTIAVNGHEFTLAPEGKSGVYCFECNTCLPEGSLSGASAKTVTCPGCGEPCKSGLTGVSIRHDNQTYLTKNNIKNTHWYHTTSHPDWDTNPTNPMVHLGSETAAHDRIHDIPQGEHIYLYEVELNPDIQVDDRLYEEDQFDPTQGNYAPDHNQHGANRYVNYYENPGSISLYAARGAFRIVNKTRL